MKSDAARYRKWLAGGRLLEVNYESLFDSNGAISNLVVHKFSSFLGVDVDEVKTRPIERQQDQVQVETAKRVKRELRPMLTRAGYKNLYDLPKAA